MKSDDRQPPSPGRGSLEDRLRHLPQPSAPPQLRNRILAGIPIRLPTVRPSKPLVWRLSLAGLGVAAGILLLIVLLPRHMQGPHVPQRPVVPEKEPKSIVAYRVNTDPKETDPCYILPPMPDWR